MGRRPAINVSTTTNVVNTTQRTIGRSSTKKEKAAVSNNRNVRMATNMVYQNRLDIFRIRGFFVLMDSIDGLRFRFVSFFGLHFLLIVFE